MPRGRWPLYKPLSLFPETGPKQAQASAPARAAFKRGHVHKTRACCAWQPGSCLRAPAQGGYTGRGSCSPRRAKLEDSVQHGTVQPNWQPAPAGGHTGPGVLGPPNSVKLT